MTHFWIFENSFYIIQVCFFFLLENGSLVIFLEPRIFQNLLNWDTLSISTTVEIKDEK